MIWLKIQDKQCFEKNINIGFVYNSPIDFYTKRQIQDLYHELQNKLITLPRKDYTIIGGAFNARTGSLKDFVCENEKGI